MSTNLDHLRAWALHFAERGWHVFPLTPGAKAPPLVDRWEQRASTDPDRICEWWAHTTANIGLATGPSGLVVVDLDTPEPGEPVPDRWRTLGVGSGCGALRALAGRHDTTITPTYAVRTPSGGWHLYYTTPPGTAPRNTRGDAGWKIDTRAHGGYVVAPGSLAPTGGYELIDDRDPAELPGWLHRALTPRPSTGLPVPVHIATGRRTAYVAAAVDGECRRVTTAALTEHNRSLSCAAFALGQLVGAGLLPEPDARAALTDAAAPRAGMDCDCTPREITRVIGTSLRAGITRPRRTVHHRGDAA